MKYFAIIGACGYIAPRHLQAINDTGNKLVSAYDPMDSVGILDRYSQDVQYFKTFEEFCYFNRYQSKKPVDYVAICSPNYLHKSHIAASLEMGANVICEKPLVLTRHDIDELHDIETKTGKKVYTVLQLRVHDAIKTLRDEIKNDPRQEKFDIDLCYMTSRGPWYHQTWKADTRLSGGLPTNIGVHFYDMLTWLFGSAVKNELHIASEQIFGGYLELERANVKWILSISKDHLPQKAIDAGMTTYRSITINGKEIEFSGGFTDLHNKVYQDILDGRGYGLDDAAEAISITEHIRHASPIGIQEHSHSVLRQI